MRPPPQPSRGAAVAALLILALVAACGSPLGLPRASIENRVDTLSLYALSGTPVASPSGYRLEFRQAVRTDQTTAFDFAFDIDAAGRALLLPTGALHLGKASGGQISALPFDSISLAPDRNYQLDSALVVDSGTVAIVHSSPTTCSFGISAVYYAKLHVLALDTTSAPNGRRIVFEILVDTNCGYRGLEPGLPSR
ncbi:MAG TPA: hypothetical protein VN908_07620 [Gemmatimonadales bacterium]|nr:hypothetical protein [Gemmatimonadales bacterium]